jgi:hypothetical protein
MLRIKFSSYYWTLNFNSLHVRIRVQIRVRFGVRFGAKGGLESNLGSIFSQMCLQTVVMGL